MDTTELEEKLRNLPPPPTLRRISINERYYIANSYPQKQDAQNLMQNQRTTSHQKIENGNGPHIKLKIVRIPTITRSNLAEKISKETRGTKRKREDSPVPDTSHLHKKQKVTEKDRGKLTTINVAREVQELKERLRKITEILEKVKTRSIYTRRALKKNEKPMYI